MKRLPDLIVRDGMKRVLIVTDKSIVSLGLLEGLLGAMKERGLGHVLYDGTVPNPTIDNIEEARSLYLANGCQGIVAFGGGSPMDCAKAVGARVVRPRTPVGRMKGLLKVWKRLPPIYAVPTTAGTGSEATLAAIVSNPAKKEKYAINDPALIPRVAVLDAELTAGLPPAITSTTGMDALTHAVEAYIGRSNTASTARDAVEAVRLILEFLPRAVRDGKDLDAREAMLKASFLAGKAFTRAYVGYVHAIAHTMGGFYHMAHGMANAILLPIVLRRYGKAAERRLAELARKSGAAAESLPDERAAELLVTRIEEFRRDFGIPERIDAIRDEDIPEMARRAAYEANPLYPVPLVLTRKQLERLYSTAAGRG